MATPLEVRGLGTTKHRSFEYAISDIYIPGWKNEQKVIAHIRREIHLVDDLKANMLIGNDIIEPEGIVIDAKKREMHIGSCDITAKVEIKSSKSVIRPIHLRKTTIIPPRAEMPIAVHHSGIPEAGISCSSQRTIPAWHSMLA